MAGSQIESQSKLMFYPTDVSEIYRMLGIIGRVRITDHFREHSKEILGESLYTELITFALDNNIERTNVIYDYFVNKKDYPSINKYFKLTLNYASDYTTMCDLFAGEGVWLELFKTAIPNEYEKNQIHLIANELEENRYNQIKSKGIVDEHHNFAFEEFNKLPKNSISLMLYNPPYGDTNGIRNVKHYLDLIIEQELIHNSKGTNSHYNGNITMVIRKDDLLDSLGLIIKHFEIYADLLYKVNEEEYTRYKQFVVYAKLRKEPYDMNNSYWAMKYQEEVQSMTNLINSDPEFNVKMYEKSYRNRIDLPSVPYRQMIFNITAAKKSSQLKSNLNNSNWHWMKELTEIKDMSKEKIVKPTPMKIGEVANIIASGMINGEMNLNDKGNHVVVGGTRSELRSESYKEKDANGESVTVTKKILYSQPYLNVLISENGKLKIKEIVGGEIAE